MYSSSRTRGRDGETVLVSSINKKFLFGSIHQHYKKHCNNNFFNKDLKRGTLFETFLICNGRWLKILHPDRTGATATTVQYGTLRRERKKKTAFRLVRLLGKKNVLMQAYGQGTVSVQMFSNGVAAQCSNE
jgi:hypothetical protein